MERAALRRRLATARRAGRPSWPWHEPTDAATDDDDEALQARAEAVAKLARVEAALMMLLSLIHISEPTRPY